ncbi:hypothetical protein WN943_010050 [Citrus x changshan-huyou]|uniref:Uncharacterized protein n=1 Tax=Citrus sinensis TaxID=2711 RepID=A0A067D447_CITSI|nr:hypothetical protein CISIN_1g034212mg [Citrus sinensis]GAY46803.1 hypothetical protein CUMW_099790 [Citrus unshiu]
MNHTNTNRFRKPSDSSHESPHYDVVVSDKHKRPLLQVQGVKSGLGVEKLVDRKSTSGDSSTSSARFSRVTHQSDSSSVADRFISDSVDVVDEEDEIDDGEK